MNDVPTPGVPAGRLSAWVQITLGPSASAGVEVPCGSCTACCRSSYFIPIAPDETETLARIPRALRVPAPGLPKGTVVLGYDERGHCPMLVDDRCSIYDARPRTCRTFDCRVFAAAGVSPLVDGKTAIAERVEQWEFDLPTPGETRVLEALRAAGTFLQHHPECFPDGLAPRDSGQLARAAVRVHGVFMTEAEPSADVVRAALGRAGGLSSEDQSHTL